MAGHGREGVPGGLVVVAGGCLGSGAVSSMAGGSAGPVMNHYVSKRIRSPFSYYGGKSGMCRRILELSPPHKVYVEPFAGGLSVLLNKYRSPVEIASDLSTELALFFNILIERCEELIERVSSVRIEKATFLEAQGVGGGADDLTRAVSFLYLQHMGFSGVGNYWMGSKSQVAVWKNLPHNLKVVSARLRGVKILVRSALEVIPEYDSPETFHYLDPPYYGATRSSVGQYLHEFSEMDHLYLLKLIKNLKGSVIISGYDCPLYNQELADWDRVEVDGHAMTPLVRGVPLPLRTEVLWVRQAWV